MVPLTRHAPHSSLASTWKDFLALVHGFHEIATFEGTLNLSKLMFEDEFDSINSSTVPFPMTSFIIKSHLDRRLPLSWNTESESDCPFCKVIRGESPAFKVFEDDHVLAILGGFRGLILFLCIYSPRLGRHTSPAEGTYTSNTQSAPI